jgi:hypothetical protein
MPLRAACLDITTTAEPNEIIEDRHILEALQIIIDDSDWEKDPELDIIGFLVDAINEGIEMYNNAMRLKGSAEQHLNVALREIRDSVERHHSNSNPRSYINFIKRFVPI